MGERKGQKLVSREWGLENYHHATSGESSLVHSSLNSKA